MNEKIKELIKKFIKNNTISTFIETGTQYGTTSHWASRFFKTVYTIEKDPKLFKSTTEKFHNCDILFFNGESPTCLSSILEKIEDIVIFWLDAHWSDRETSGEETECPILEEIQVINEWNRECIILIDDANLFSSPPYKPHKPEHWPSISKIIDEINRLEKKYIVIIYDVIIAVPFSIKPMVEKFCVNENTKAWKKRCEKMKIKEVSHLKKSLYHFKRFLTKPFHG